MTKKDATQPSKSKNPFGSLHQKQSQRVDHRKGTARFLLNMADEDHKRIAKLIQKWLEEDGK